MSVKSIITLPRIAAEDFTSELLEARHVAVISIIDFNADPVFTSDIPGRIITLRFDDVRPEKGITFDEAIPFTSAHANIVHTFLSEIHTNTVITHLIIHCTAGVARSGAVACYARKFYDLDIRKFLKANPYILPNLLVYRTLLAHGQ